MKNKIIFRRLAALLFPVLALCVGLLALLVAWLASSDWPTASAGFLSFLTAFSDPAPWPFVLDAVPPMLLAALAIALPMQGRLLNLGVTGQALFGTYVAKLAASDFALPQWGCALFAMIGGAALAMIPAFLRKAHCPVFLSSLLLSVAAVLLIAPPEAALSDTALLPVSLAVALLLPVILKTTVFGYELRLGSTVGKFAGMPVRRNALWAMVIAGALAGLAGVCLNAQDFGGFGFAALTAALLSGGSALAAVPWSIVVTALRSALPQRLCGLLLLFPAIISLLWWLRGRRRP